MHSVNFKLDGTDGAARATTFTTVHGSVQTPVFMPVGTQGAIRAVSPQHVMQTNTQILLANTYHLSQRRVKTLWRSMVVYTNSWGGCSHFDGFRWLPSILIGQNGF